MAASNGRKQKCLSAAQICTEVTEGHEQTVKAIGQDSVLCVV